MLDKIMVDTHTHTVLSGHAWSTLRENAVAAAKKGLYGFCLTDHAHALPGSGPFFRTAAQRMLPVIMEGVRIYSGVEANIVNLDGGLDVDDKQLFATEFCIGSLHDLCTKPGTSSENTNAFIGALRHPCVDILGHIDDYRTPNEFSVVVSEAGRLGKLVEINNNSILIRRGGRERVEELARLCAVLGTRVAVASDAHLDDMVGSVTPALELLERIGFPEELIVNRSADAFKEYLNERNARMDSVREHYAAAGVPAKRIPRR
ncbi:MAG: PHP domain-containing protein [Planctomycetes bacterium]|nr:PHP domain-containing protein [Planctomycetota bacterium]